MASKNFATTTPRLAIIGGGISGLAAAYFLEQSSPSWSIELFESEPQLGGKLRTVRRDGMVLELGAESFLARKTEAIQLCTRIGLQDQLRGTRPRSPKTYVYSRDQLRPLPPGFSGFVPGSLSALLGTSLLSWRAKCRVVGDLIMPARRSTGDESVAEFVTRRLGREAYTEIVQPLLCGIFSGDGSQLSLAATYPELRMIEQKFGSLIRGLRQRHAAQQVDLVAAARDALAVGNDPMENTADSPPAPFLTLRNGVSQLVETLAGQLGHTKLHCNAPVDQLMKTASQEWIVAGKPFDAVLLTTSADVASRLLQTEAPALSRQLAAIPHVSTATANLWFSRDHVDHDLNGYGFVIPADQQNGMTAVTWTSSKHFDRSNDTTCLMRAYLGRAGDEVSGDATDEQLIGTVRSELRRTMGVTAEPRGWVVRRWPNGSPQYTLGHLDRLQRIESACRQVQGLYLCGASYRGVGIPDCIRQAREAVEALSQIDRVPEGPT